MTDREQIELAAKAAGIITWQRPAWRDSALLLSDGVTLWNPLTDDGDALRLAVKLNMSLNIPVAVRHDYINNPRHEGSEHDPYAATRRAIVRAAAEIGAKL